MEGMTNQSAESLVALAASWLKAPAIENRTRNIIGCVSHGYNQAQRAYLLTLKGTKMKFTLKASETNPVRNLCFVIKNWGDKDSMAQIKINEILQNEGPNFRQGVTIDTDGTYSLIVWLGLSATTTQNFEITKSGK